MQVLAAAFPQMNISSMSGKKIDASRSLSGKLQVLAMPDGLINERVYRVIGAAMNRSEACAALDISSKGTSATREVRLRLLRFSADTLVAVLQYAFENPSPATTCPSIAKLLLLTTTHSSIKVDREMELETTRHDSLQSVGFADLGRGSEDLLVESDWGGAGAFESDLLVIDVSPTDFHPLLTVPTRAYSNLESEDASTQKLDLDRTREEQGKQMCFTKTAWAEKNTWFNPPHVTHPCYPAK